MNRAYWLVVIALIIQFTADTYPDDLVGSERCKICHKEEYKKFTKTKHKDTSKSLNEQQKKNRECLVCHSMDKEGKFMEIGCEACHGGGKYYSYDYVMKDKELSRLIGLKKPTEETCKKCHNEDTTKINKFDIKKGLKEIEHKRADKQGEKPNK